MTNTVVLTTGGSGGHIFPAQSVAEELLKRGFKVIFITDKRGKAFQNLPDVQTYRLMAESVTGRSFIGKIIALFKLWLGAGQAMKLLIKLKPDLVIGFGGYASLPTVISAQMLRIPTMLHEQNAILGRANRIAARKVRLIATSFPTVQRVPKNIPTIHVGQPVRAPILEKSNAPYPNKPTFNLLVFGGSQGARFFSDHIPQVLMNLPKEYRSRMEITQQARPEDEEKVQKAYEQAGFKSLTIAPFFKNMPDLLNEANLVIGRGGAGTLTEVMVVGRPALIIPLPSAADNHQVANAQEFASAQGGWVVEQKDFDADKLTKRLQELMDNPQELEHMAHKAHSLAVINAAERMADIIQDLIKGIKNDK